MKYRIAIALSAFALSCWGATSTAWDTSGYNDFLKGRLTGLSLSADGALRPGPAVRFDTSLEQPTLWSLVPAPDGSLFAATGHRGKVIRLAPNGKASSYWSAEQPEIFAIAVDRKGLVYAGTSPNGGVYRIENGKGTEIWHSPEKYIWGLQAAPDGGLYVATGDHGRIYRIESGGQANIYYETGQANITALSLAENGHLYAGSEPNGLLYEITASKQGTILFDSPLPEIRAIALADDGSVYAAAMGGSVASRVTSLPQVTATPTGTVVATTPTVVTVTESGQSIQQGDAKPPVSQTKGNATSTLIPQNTIPGATVIDLSGMEKSAIYRVHPDRTVETLRSSKDENIYDLFLDGESIIFSTDFKGRTYQLTHGKANLLEESGDGEATRLVKTDSGFAVALSTPARVLSFGLNAKASGRYDSQVHDSTTVARWGHLQWQAAGQGILFRTRTGNAARPDATWSSWSLPITGSAIGSITSPNARFIQWSAEWPPDVTANLDNVSIGYLPQNTPPAIRSISATPVLTTNSVKTTATAASSTSAYSVTVTDTGEPPATTSVTASNQIVSRQTTTQLQISWQADDADGDKLVYALYFRPEDGSEWQLIRNHMVETALLLDADVFADGRYFFRVVASDAPSNAIEYARQTELISPPVLVDNTPPVVVPGSPQRTGNQLDLLLEATDKTSSLRRCEYSLDAGSWQPIEALGGVTDSPREQFKLHLEKLRPGEHLLVFRVYDAANNAGLARVVVR